MKIEKYIDHTLLKPTATPEDIEKLCDEAKKYGFYSVCVNPGYVELCKKLLKDSDVKVATVISFPLGADTIENKVYQTVRARADGADEFDMVVNIGQVKAGNFDHIGMEFLCVKNAVGGDILKVILETSYLTDEEITKVCELAVVENVDFVKTSTGFSDAGATVHHVELMKKVVGDKAEVKASGGIRDYETAMKMIEAGATRLGCSSSIKIVEQQK